jgi:hypothetical protein
VEPDFAKAVGWRWFRQLGLKCLTEVVYVIIQSTWREMLWMFGMAVFEVSPFLPAVIFLSRML